MREIRWKEWSERHIARHGVRPGEVEEVVHQRPRLVRAGKGGTTLVYGQTAAGRHLLVVLSPDPEGGTSFVVTARDLSRGEKAEFQRRASR